MTPEFSGATYEPNTDKGRLTDQLGKVRRVMMSGGWFTLAQIAEKAEAPQASVSARLRDLRKQRFGAYAVERRGVHGRPGLFEYRLKIPGPSAESVAHGKTRSENAGAP